MQLHGNAALSLNKRRQLCRRVVDEKWSLTSAAAAAEVSERTAAKWVGRFRCRWRGGPARPALGRAQRSHNRTPELRIQAIAALRRLRFTAAVIAETPRDARDDRVGHPDPDRARPAGPARARARQSLRARPPGELLHIDVKKLGRIERGAGTAHAGWQAQAITRPVSPTPLAVRRGTIGWEYVHVCVDDATRLAYAEVLVDEKATTAAGFLRPSGRLLPPPRDRGRGGVDR